MEGESPKGGIIPPFGVFFAYFFARAKNVGRRRPSYPVWRDATGKRRDVEGAVPYDRVGQ